ncbi:MAG: hypothetical protein K6B38_13470 [Ruminococcus sp.]|nr:hypothetical protein [Ruminococcus sp.]
MKTYDETIDAIFSKGDALIEQRRQKSVKIKQTSYAVSGVCAAAIVGVGIWRMNDLKKLHDNRHSEIETVEEITTTSTQTETYTTTSTFVSDTEKTKNTTAATTKNTVTSSTKSKTTETTQITDKTSINESQSRKTTVQASNQTETTTAQTEKAATTDITTKEPATTDTTTKTYDTITESVSKQTTITTTAANTISGASPNGEEGTTTTTTQFTDDITRNLPSIFNTISLTGADSLDSKMREQGFVYSYDLINEDDIDDLLKEIHLNVNYEGNDIERDARIYKIKRFSADALIAVKFEGRDDYFLYCNKLYAPETLGEFISAFSLDSKDYIRECYHGKVKADDINPEKAWDLLTAERLITDVTDSCTEKYFFEYDRIWITSISEPYHWLSVNIGVDPQGYIITDTNTIIPDRYFYIGEEKAEEIIGYCK